MRGRALIKSIVHTSSKVESGSYLVNSTLDRHSFTGYDCSLNHCDVGSFCSIASRVSIGGVSHPSHFVSTSPVFLSHKDSIKAKFAHHNYLPLLRSEIGSDVWIGEGAFVKAGVCIGHGAIIGMGAVVTRDVAPYAVVAGNPARVIKYRFDEQTIEGLLASKWWMWSDEKLKIFGPFMHEPQSFLQEIKKI